MRKIRWMILLFALMLSVCGCSSQQDDSNKKIQKQLDKLQKENEKLNDRLEKMQSESTVSDETPEQETAGTKPSTQASAKEEILSAEELYETAIISVVEITGYLADGTSTGTGFFYDKRGTVITNYHVIDGCDTAYITLSDGTEYKVNQVLGYNAAKDIAVLETSCSRSVPLEFRTNGVKTGETVYAIGSSLGLEGSLSDGIVSSAERDVDGNTYIQTTAPISSGNSGGPLLDKEGLVVGITSASFIDGQNLNLAIPIGEVEKISTKNPVSLAELFKARVEWLTDWEFFYYDEMECYVLTFQLTDEDMNPVMSSGTLELTITNDDGVVVYEGMGDFTEEYYENWIYEDYTEHNLVTFYLDPMEILEGTSTDGIVSLTVYGEGFSFEEATIEVFDLPVKEMQVYCDDLPFYANSYGYYDSSVYSSVTVTEILWEVIYDDSMLFTFSGEKTYDKDGTYGTNGGEFNWLLYDENYNLLDSGWVYISGLRVGDTFRETAYSWSTIEPGKSYTIVLTETEW